jgi:UDP-N-acetylmuramyl pentapeptide synthase
VVVERVTELVGDADAVLLKGSRSMRLERVGAALAPEGGGHRQAPPTGS